MATEKRLIDANELVDTIYRSDEELHSTQWETDEIVDQIDRIPTVDAVEVVHGRWGAFEVFPGAASLNGYPCSVCGNRVPATLYNLNYCPNCGAKMDGDGNG